MVKSPADILAENIILGTWTPVGDNFTAVIDSQPTTDAHVTMVSIETNDDKLGVERAVDRLNEHSTIPDKKAAVSGVVSVQGEGKEYAYILTRTDALQATQQRTQGVSPLP